MRFNFLQSLHSDAKKYPVSTVEERAKRLNVSKWDVFTGLANFNHTLINGKGFDVTLDQIKDDFQNFPLDPFTRRGQRLKVYPTVVMKLCTLIPTNDLISKKDDK